MFCTECGTKVADTAKFCFNCGTKLFNEEIVTENNKEVISDENTDASKNSDPKDIDSFFKSDPNYFGDLSNEVVAKAVEHDDESAIPQIVLPKFDFDAMMNEEFSRVVDSPITKVEKAAKNVLNDVDITDVMLNPKKEIAKFGFNVFKEIFGKNNPP